VPGKVIGPSFAADEVPDAIEAVIETYLRAAPAAASASSTPRAAWAPALPPRRRRRAPRHGCGLRPEPEKAPPCCSSPAHGKTPDAPGGAGANDADVLERWRTLCCAPHRAVVLHFPKWTDGRAYSQAVLLRARLRFAGEIRATGEVLADMLPLLRRCGFDAVQLRADQQLPTPSAPWASSARHYQSVPPERAASGATP
jgi:hypothetical protein